MDKRIRILHITQAVGGGVERYVQMFLKNMNHSEFENYLLVSCDADIDVYTSVADHITQVDLRREIGLHDIMAIVKVRKIIRQIRPDLIYAHSSKAGAVARIANIGLNSICVYNPHGWAFNMKGSPKKQRLYAVLERILAPLSDRIICISDTEKRTALEHGIGSEEKITVIHNGIDIDQHSSQTDPKINRGVLGIPADAFVVGMVGRISRQKAPDVFVSMAEYVLKKIPEAYFLMVGDGDLREVLTLQIQTAGIENRFRITGWVDNPQDYVRLFDVAVLLSRWEGFGLVLPEYMLAQKPIVASNVDAIPELIQDRFNGLLVAPDDPMAAGGAVYELYQNAELKETLVRQGVVEAYKKYDVKRVVNVHMRLFRQWIRG